MKMKNLLKLFKKPQSSAGYTLVELLTAASATVVVIGAAGFGLVSTMEARKTGKTQVERRTEVNRGLDFISDEVRLAEKIETDPSTYFEDAKKEGTLTFSPPDDAKPVLALTIPGVGKEGVLDKVFYYVSPKPPSSEWIGPIVIYRFGPSLGSNGQYTNENNPSAWGAEPLIDRVDDNLISPSSCTGSQIEAKGFAACVDSNQKRAQLYMNGKFNQDESEVYEGTTTVFARAGSNPKSVDGLDLPSEDPCPVINGKLDCEPPGGTGDTLLTIEVLGSDYSCDLSGLNWAVKTEIEITRVNKDGPHPDKTPTVIEIQSGDNKPKEIQIYAKPDTPPNDPNVYWDEVKIRSVPELPGGVESCDNEANKIEHALDTKTPENTPQTAALINGNDLGEVNIQDVPIGNLTGFNAQQSTGDSLEGQGYVANGKIKLNDKQQIILFEIGKTDINNSGFDLQDNMVLITTESVSSDAGGS